MCVYIYIVRARVDIFVYTGGLYIAPLASVKHAHDSLRLGQRIDDDGFHAVGSFFATTETRVN